MLKNDKSPDEPERGLFPELGYDPTGDRIVDENGQPLSDEEKLVYAEHFRKKVKPKIKKVVEGTLETLVENDIISGFSPYKENGSKKNSVGIAGYEIICKED